MPVVVEAPDNEVVPGDELPFCRYDRVLIFLRQLVRYVHVIEESRLVGDDQIVAGSGSTLKHIESGHHGHGNAGDDGVGITLFKSVYCIALPGYADMLLNSSDYLTGGKGLSLSQCAVRQQNGDR